MTFWIHIVCAFCAVVAAAAPASEAPIYVVSGGFRSCEGKSPAAMKISEVFDCYIKNAQKPAPEVIYSCFNGETDPKKGRLQFVRAGDAKDRGEVSTESMDKAVDAFGDYVKKVAGKRPVVFVGHSHGAYLAMRTILKADVRTAGIVTFDPISREKCPPSELAHVEERAKACLGKHALDLDRRKFLEDWRAIRASAECTMFPSDISEAEQEKIFKDRAIAAHYYQTADRVLHSDALAPASLAEASHRIDQPVALTGRRIPDSYVVRMMRLMGQAAHADVWKDPRPWKRLRSDVTKAFGTTLDESCYLKAPPAAAEPKAMPPQSNH